MAKQTEHDQGRKLAAASNKKIDKLTNQEPSHNSKAKIKSWNSSVRFPDLLRKEVIGITPDQTETIMIRQNESSEVGSTGDGVGNNSDITKVDLCVSSPLVPVEDKPLKSPVPSWEKYFEFLQQLAKEPWVDSLDFLRLDPRQVENHYFQLPNFVDDNGVVLFDGANKIYVSVSRICCSNRIFSVLSFSSFEKEMKSSLVFLLDEKFNISWRQIYRLFQGNVSNSLIKCIKLDKIFLSLEI